MQYTKNKKGNFAIAFFICILSSEVASRKECYAVCEESRNRGRAYPSDSDSLEYAEVYVLYTVYKARADNRADNGLRGGYGDTHKVTHKYNGKCGCDDNHKSVDLTDLSNTSADGHHNSL